MKMISDQKKKDSLNNWRNVYQSMNHTKLLNRPSIRKKTNAMSAFDEEEYFYEVEDI